MEQTPPESFLEMTVDYDGGHILQDTVRWTKFISVTGLIVGGLFTTIILLALALAGKEAIAQTVPYAGAAWGLLLTVSVFVINVLGFMIFMLLRFSVLVRRGIERQDQSLFNKGLKALKLHFLVGGILAILSLLANLVSLTTL